MSVTVSPVYTQDEPPADNSTNTSVLELAKTDAITELLSASYAADLALNVALRTAECTKAELRCAPLFLAQDVILGPWNFVKLLRVVQELQDSEVSTIFQPREYKTPSLAPTGDLPADIVSLARYALEQQVALYGNLEAWQITLERYSTAVGSNNEVAAAAQRRALDAYSLRASTAAASVNATSLQFLERITPLMRHFASAIAAEDAEAAKDDLRDTGFGPELRERFSVLGIRKADSDALLQEIFAISIDAPVDLLGGLTEVANGYDKLADLTAAPVDAVGNVRPVAHAGPDLALQTGAVDPASVTLNGKGSTDPEAGVLEYLWTWESMKASGSTPTITLPLGTHYIALTVADRNGGTDVDLVTITVADTAAPLITGLTATPDVLWPPTGELVPVELDMTVVDNDDPMPFCQVISVGVNEPARDTVGATEPDIVFDGSLTILLRAERAGANAGRAYTVTVQCTDKSNQSSLSSTVVSVPTDAGRK